MNPVIFQFLESLQLQFLYRLFLNPYNSIFHKVYFTSHRKNFVAERIINVWNSLPSAVNFSTNTYFRRAMHDVDLSSFESVKQIRLSAALFSVNFMMARRPELLLVVMNRTRSTR